MGKNLGFSFSLSRLLGVQTFKQGIARKTGIPTTKHGFNAKLGRMIINIFK